MSEEKWIKMMEYGRRLGCHQMPERSFFIKGYQFPVCARCTGAILSFFIAIVLFFKKRIPIGMCFALSSVMLIDWGLQYLEIKESNNTRRFVTGFVGGFGYFTAWLHLFRFAFKR